jgi:hypothetical protein
MPVSEPDPVEIGDLAPWQVALMRAAGLAFAQGLGAFAVTSQITHEPWALVSAVTMAVAIALGWRAGGEAVVDTARAKYAATKAMVRRR